MRPSYLRAALVLAAVVSIGCDGDLFHKRIQGSRAQGYHEIADAGVGLPYFLKMRMDPTWDTSHPERLARVDRLDVIDHRSQKQNESLFRGSPAFVVFFFSQCPGICPTIIGNLKEIEKRIGPDTGVRYVAVSVDPKNDSPEILAKYAKRMNTGGKKHWHFVTGTAQEVQRLHTEVFAIELAKKEDGRLIHSERIFAVDKDGFIRAVLNSTEVQMPEQAQRVAAALTETKTASSR